MRLDVRKQSTRAVLAVRVDGTLKLLLRESEALSDSRRLQLIVGAVKFAQALDLRAG
jgi:hypothetical protein